MDIKVSDRKIERKKKFAKKAIGGLANRKRKLLVVPEHVMKSTEVTIRTNEHGRLVIPDYQRSEVQSWVGSLTDAMKRGSQPEPIDVVVRTWEKGDRLYIVDGQQRMWAHINLDVPIRAKVHKCNSMEEEKSLFLVLNQHVRLSATTFLNAHPGKTTELLNKVNEDPQHPLYRRILLTSTYTGSHERMQPATVARSLSLALGAGAHGIIEIMSACDAAVTADKAKAEAFLTDLGHALKGKPSADALHSFGLFWKKHGPLSKRVLGRFRRLRLDNVTGTTAADRRAAIQHRLERCLIADADAA
jgi:hypothetical protein